MKNSMNLTLNKSSIDPIEHFIKVLSEFIETLKTSKQTFTHNVKFCRELRTNRKIFEKKIGKTINSFHTLPENKQAEVELAFYNALKKLESIAPDVKKGIDDDRQFILFSLLLKREVNKTIKFLRKSQSKMSAQLYPDRSKEILDNPELYQKLVDAWVDVAD